MGPRPLSVSLLQDAGSGLASYLTLLILITRRREDELGQHREQLTLGLAILGEQKNAQIIQLLEVLRRDSPTLRDRIDHQAEALTVHADTQMVLDAIVNKHAEMLGSLDTPNAQSDEHTDPTGTA